MASLNDKMLTDFLDDKGDEAVINVYLIARDDNLGYILIINPDDIRIPFFHVCIISCYFDRPSLHQFNFP